MNCKIAIDDFGTDYSNFARILEIQADYIKIDGSFIKDLDKNENSFRITKSITDFAHNVGAKVIAEFVHNEEVQKMVVQLGIDYSQGYLFSIPKESV